MSKITDVKSLQKWGFWLLSCSFLLFIAGIMLVILAFSTGEEYGCNSQLNNNIIPQGVGSHDDLANFYTKQLGYKVTITSDFCDFRRGGSRCPGNTNGCSSDCATTRACHFGYDFSIRTGSPVVAAYPGIVVQFWRNSTKTYGVVIQSLDKTHYVAYSHMNINPEIKEGKNIEVGTLLGTIDGSNHLDIKKFTNLTSWACTAFDW